MGGQEVARGASVSVSTEAGGWCMAHSYPHRGPILAIRAGETSVTFAGALGLPVSSAERDFAASLRAAVNAYAAECERLCPRQDKPPRDTAA